MTRSNAQIPEISPAAGSTSVRWGAVWIQALVIGVLLVAVFWEPIRSTAGRWTRDSDWSHGWLVPLFSVYLVYTRRASIERTPRSIAYFGLLVVIASLAGYFYFYAVWPVGYLRLMSLLGAVFGIVLFLTGWRMLRVVWLPILFLWFAIPVPDQIYVTITMPMRMLSTQIAALLLNAIPDAAIETQGVVIAYFRNGVRGELNVEEACAGMRLMMAFVTLGVAMAFMSDRPTWQRICMVVACAPISIICNVIRVTITGFLTVLGRGDLAQGTTHELLGLAMLPIALGLFMLIAYVLSHLVVDDPNSTGTDLPAEEPA